MSVRRKTAFFILAFSLSGLLFIVSIEGLSYVYLTRRGADRAQPNSILFARAASGLDSWQPSTHPNTYADVRRLSPYFGHVFVDGNNYGFISKYDFPYRRQNGDYVIGIFGGSTAMHCAMEWEASSYWEKLKVKGNPQAKIVLVNLAISGYRQPQQLYVASKFFDTLDLALVLDGWNESQIDQCPYDPAEFPQSFRLLYSRELDQSQIKNLRAMSKSFRAFSAWLANSKLADTNTARLTWEAYRIRLAKATAALATSPISKARSLHECESPELERRFTLWRKYSMQMLALARAQNLPLYNFIQPNPYMDGAKPLSEEEKRIVQWQENRAPNQSKDRIQTFYNFYKRARPPHSTSLIHLFAQDKRILYIDPYTHLNPLGCQLVAQAMIRRLQNQSGEFDPQVQ